jgi:uncharacterized repeat protein (TIGR01451 family)
MTIRFRRRPFLTVALAAVTLATPQLGCRSAATGPMASVASKATPSVAPPSGSEVSSQGASLGVPQSAPAGGAQGTFADDEPSAAALDGGDGSTKIVGGEDAEQDVRQVSYDPPSLPPEAFTGGPAVPRGSVFCPPQGAMAGTQFVDPRAAGVWQPDGLYGPWPYDEYLFDGGDRDTPVKVDRDWTVRGIDQEDTIAHFDTLQGRTEVTPSNRVPIYAPRFASVRKVYGLEINEGAERAAGANDLVRLNSQDTRLRVTTAIQPRQPVLEHNFRSSVALFDRTGGVNMQRVQPLQGVANHFMPHEDFRVIRHGALDANEKARLAERVRAALTWTTDQSVQVTIGGSLAYEAKGAYQPGETVQFEMPPGKPRMRIVKVASKSEANPGEEIDFTLRFDNVGDQRVGNVTIVDSLTSRLEYVPGSAQCDLNANFGTQTNDVESLLLRWEIVEPLPVGKGGVIRFKCRVR